MKRKKLVQINTVCNNSTGHIMHDIQVAANHAGYDTLSIVGRRNIYTDIPCVKFGNDLSFWIHVIITTTFDKQGWGSYYYTKRIVNRLRKEKPDIIHLHNIHGYYLNLPVLFKYLINEYEGKLFWTFHDCWPITGHCPHFILAKCEKWKTGCHHCPNKKEYPISWGVDSSKSNYKWKKNCFSKLDDLTIITPTIWLKEKIEASFLNTKRIEVVNNGVDSEIFYPRDYTKIQQRYNVTDKKIVLGVASIWDERKGLREFLNIAEKIDEKYVIILVGLSETQCKKLSANVIGLTRMENTDELAVLYSMADVFINPSVEETFSMVVVEAMACGTPVIVKAGSAPAELVTKESGYQIEGNAVTDYLHAIETVVNMPYQSEQIVKCAMKYSKQEMQKRILKLYEESIND